MGCWNRDIFFYGGEGGGGGGGGEEMVRKDRARQTDLKLTSCTK